MPRTVTLENATLDALAKNPQALAQLPCLTALVNTKKRIVTGGGCSSCKKSAAARDEIRAYNDAKQCLAQIDGGAKALLKQLLHADEIKVLVAQAGVGVQPLWIR